MNKAGELFEYDYRIFLHFGVAALYFLVISMCIFWLFGIIQRRLNRHLSQKNPKWQFAVKYLR